MVIEWADLHRAELMDNWERARQGQRLDVLYYGLQPAWMQAEPELSQLEK